MVHQVQLRNSLPKMVRSNPEGTSLSTQITGGSRKTAQRAHQNLRRDKYSIIGEERTDYGKQKYGTS